MTEVVAELSGVLYDKLSRTSRPVFLRVKGNAMAVEAPPDGGGDGDHIWGGGNVPMPSPPIANVPGAPGYRPPGDHIWGGGNEPFPTPPIFIPPNVPPTLTPPTAPNPGDPVTPVPPPEGSGGWPVQPITPPPYIVVMYPGVGPVTVPAPLTAQPK